MKRHDLPTPFTNQIDAIIKTRNQWLLRDSSQRFRNAYTGMSEFATTHLDLSGDTVILGASDELSRDAQKKLHTHLKAFMPWRKGPFRIFGIDVDAEWRSDRKWNRLRAELPDLEGKTILDVGCNNGYYMFRMAHHNPEFVLGIDPTVQYHYAFKGLNAIAGLDFLEHTLLGVEHVHLFPDCFDVIFLMGILYHHPSPLEILKTIRSALKPDGILILETQGIPGEEPVALFPRKRYAKVPGTYFVPTANCLKNMMVRAGLHGIRIFETHAMSSMEQRTTEWMTYQSYKDFVDPDNSERTVEGYPAPVRIYARASR